MCMLTTCCDALSLWSYIYGHTFSLQTAVGDCHSEVLAREQIADEKGK